MLKPYEDFLATLTENDFLEIADAANSHMQSIRETTSASENILGNQISACSFAFTNEMFKRYHGWLSEQLQ